MSSNRLHSIFGKNRKLSRDDIREYGQTQNDSLKNEIEQKAMSDDFDREAMEGWEDLSYDTSVLNRLDRQFIQPKNHTWIWVAGTALTSIFIFFLINIFNKNTEEPSIVADNTIIEQNIANEIIVEESDLIIPKIIEEMVVLPAQAQVKPEEIKEDFANRDPEHENITPIEIESLPINPIEESIPEATIIVSHKIAKEIYLHDFKLVDYRAYRAKPAIKTKQLDLSGTPASQEEKGSGDEDYTWKNVDVPYIDYIDKTIRIFSRANYKKALSRFETILKTYDNDVNANFYGGLCYYNFGEFDKAIALFDKCIDGPYSNFDEEAMWMKAISARDSGKASAAQALFQKIYREDGFYAGQAKFELAK